jgi:Family of unknown function (DUF6167)
MSRGLWFVAGAGAGVYAMTRARRAMQVLTADGLADRLAGLSVGAQLFRTEVRAGMAEKENDLRERLGLPLHGDHTIPELSAPAAANVATGPGSSDTREGND